MESLLDLFSEANVIPTALMTLVVAYWLMMIAGVVGMDMFDFDIDMDADVGIDIDPGLDIDAGADLGTGDADIQGHDGGLAEAGATDLDTGGGSTASSGGGFVRTVYDFFYLSDVPVVIVASVFVFGYWVASVTLNHFFNPDQAFVPSLLWVIPSTFVALVITKIAIIPAAAIGRKSGPEDRSRSNLIGETGVVTSIGVNEKFGQISVKRKDEPEILLNVRIEQGKPELSKNESAKIISYNNEDGTFLVELTKWENNRDE